MREKKLKEEEMGKFFTNILSKLKLNRPLPGMHTHNCETKYHIERSFILMWLIFIKRYIMNTYSLQRKITVPHLYTQETRHLNFHCVC